jgi:quinol monooxygenase YgiN
MPKLAILAKITAQPGKRDEVVAALSPMIKTASDEPGTEVYVMHTANDDPDVVWFYELYTDGAAAATHGGSPAMKEAGGRLAGLVAGRPELIMATPVEGTGITL